MARTRAAGRAENQPSPLPRHPESDPAASSTPLAPITSTASPSQTLPPLPKEHKIHGETAAITPPESRNKRKRTWDAFTRYHSQDSSSFPDYGAPQDNMASRLKRINAGGGGPVDTMSDSAKSRPRKSSEFSGSTTARRHPSESPSTSISIDLPSRGAAHYAEFSTTASVTKIPGPGLTRGAGSARKATYSKKGQTGKRTSLDAKTHVIRERHPTIESIEDDPITPTQPKRSNRTALRSTSPDVISVNEQPNGPPLTDVGSDLTRQKRPRPAGLLTRREAQGAKRLKGSSDDVDELQIVSKEPPRKVKKPEVISDDESAISTRGQIKSSFFTSPRKQQSVSAVPNLRVARAASGNFFYDSGEAYSAPIYLRGSPDHPWHFFPVDGKGRRLDDMAWLEFSLESASHVSHGSSPYLHLKRSLKKNRPPSLAIEFSAIEHPAHIAQNAKPTILHPGEPAKLKATFDTNMSRARGRPVEARNAPSTHEVHEAQPMKARNGQGSSAEEVVASEVKQGEDEGQRKTLRGQMLATTSERVTRRTSALVSSELPQCGPRRTRNLSAAPPLEDNIIRWTESHVGWKEAWRQSLIWPPTGKNRTTVDKDDIYRLDEGEFLNDNLINFWIRNEQYVLQKDNPEMLKKVHFFSTFFFEKLKHKNGKIDYEGVKGWTTKIDIFSYDYLVVPVNENAHWYLAIICNAGKLLPTKVEEKAETPEAAPSLTNVASVVQRLSEVEIVDGNSPQTETPVSQDVVHANMKKPLKEPSNSSPRGSGSVKGKFDPREPRIITLDSLGSAHPKTCGALRSYLAQEALDKKKVDEIGTIAGMKAKSIPLQDNWCDCGIYVLAYIRQFLANPDDCLQRILQKEPTGWKVEASEQRKSLRQLIFMLQGEQQAQAEKEKRAKAAKRRALKGAKDKANASAEVVSSQGSVDSPLTPGSTSANAIEAVGHNEGACSSPEKTSVSAAVTPKPSIECDLVQAPTPTGTTEADSEPVVFVPTPLDQTTPVPEAPSTPKANTEPLVSIPVSPLKSQGRVDSKNASSSNSFHTARSSPSVVDPTEAVTQSAVTTKDEDISLLARETTPRRTSEVLLISELSSSPASAPAVSTPASASQGRTKRKRSISLEITDSVPSTPRRRRLANQINDLPGATRERIEIRDDDDGPTENGVTYDGIDRKGESD